MADLTGGFGSEPAPGIALLPMARTGAGSPVTVQLRATNHAPEPRILSVTALGVDAGWLPRPVRTRPIMPGLDTTIELEISPSIGTVPARYPLVVAVQALDPVSGGATAPTAMGELTLVVDGPGQVSIDLQPADVTARVSRRITVLLRNTSSAPAEVTLDVQAPPRARVRLKADRIELAPNSDTKISGRVRVRRPRLIGQRSRHPYSITARSSGAPRYATGSVTERAFLGSGGAKLGILAALVAVWVVLALVAIPKLAQSTKNKQTAGPAASATASASAPGGSAGGSGAGGTSAGSAGSGGTAGSGGAAGTAGAAKNVRLNGSITGAAPNGVTVSLRPTSLVDEQAEGATPIGISSRALQVRGLVPQSALYRSVPLTATSTRTAASRTAASRTAAAQTANPAVNPAGTVPTSRSMLTGADGAWSFPGIAAPGYYLATFAKAGYQTQRFVINAAETVATQPLVVSLNPGQGSLSGTVTGPRGPVGGAQMTITDGTNTITTSTASTGADVGRWTVTGLSTPSTYLITASKDGLGTESKLLPLGAGATATASLTLREGVGSIVGLIQGPDSNGVVGGIGAATVTATDGTLSRTATTITTSGLAGRFNLTALPSPGKYTVTVSATGYQSATQVVTLKAGASSVPASATLVSSSATIGGVLKTNDPTSDGTGGGLVLTNSANTYKTLAGAAGSFRFNGVAPGSYVLSAELYGFTTSYLNVKAVAGLSNLNNVLTVNVIPNGVLPTTSFIKGQVTDARAGGHITCPVVTPAKPDCLLIAIDGGPFADGIDPANEYLAPTGGTGLQPGLHTITAYAPGYQQASVKVQVPLNATVNAPAISMYPAPIIKGTISSAVGQAVTLGSAASGNTPAVKANPVCVFAVVVGTTPTAAQLTCTRYSVPATAENPGCPTAQLSVPPSPTDVVCVQADVNGRFSLTVAQNGGYSVYVTPADDEYRSVPSAQLVLPLGGTVEYDATLHRKGRIDVSVLVRNGTGNTGTLIAAPAGISVRLTANGANGVTDVAPARTTDNTGSVHFDHLPPGSYTLQATAASGSGSVAAPITDDQQIGYVLSLADPLTQVVGQVVSSIGGATPTPVRDATVQVSGTLFYLLGIFPIPGPVVTVTTDSQGCFALANNPPAVGGSVTLPPVAAPDTRPCQSVTMTATASPVTQATLASTQVAATISRTGYQTIDLPSVAVTQTGVTTFTLAPDAVTFAGSLSVDPSATDLSAAGIATTSQPPGSGTINISSDAQGQLVWHDSNFPGDNRILPGNYTISASLPGFVGTTVSFRCEAATPCTPDLSAFKLTQLTGLQVAAVDSGGGAVAGATYTLSVNGVAQSPQSTSGTSVIFPNLQPNPSPSSTTYAVRIQAAGYRFDSFGSGGQQISCTPGGQTTATSGSVIRVTAASAPTSCTATLTRLGVIAGTVTAIPTPSAVQSPSNPSGSATLVAVKCSGTGANPADLITATGDGTTPCAQVDNSKTYTTSTNPDGTFRIAGNATLAGLATGWYRVTVSSLGYDSPSSAANKYVLVRATSTDTAFNPTISATPVKYTVKVQDRNSSPITGLTVTLVDSNDTIIATAVESATHGSYVFTALSPTTGRIKVIGIAVPTSYFATTVTVGGGDQSMTVTTDLNASVVSGYTMAAIGMDAAVTSNIGDVTVQIGTFSNNTFTVGTGTDNQPMTTTSSSSLATLGSYAFNNVPDGANWVVLAVGADRTGGISGYLSAQASVPVTHSQTTPQTTLTLPAVSHDVTVSVSSSVGNALAAPVTLNPVTPLPTGTARSILSATLAPTTGVPGGYSVVFSKVPFGTYTVGIDLSATGHGGVLTGGQNTLVLSASTPGPVSDAFTLSEGGLDLSVTTTAKAPDLPLAQVRLTVRKVGASTDIFTATGFDTNQAGPVAIYLPPGLYNVTATPLATAGPGWSAVSTTSPASVQAGATVAKPLTLTEVGPLPLVVHITRNGHNFTFGGTTDTATITLLPLQNQTVPAAYAAAVNANSTGNFTFTGLAPGLYQITTVVTSTPAATTANPTPTAITYNGTTDPTNITLVAGQAGDGGNGQTFNLDAIP